MAKLNSETFWERLLAPAFVFFFKLLYPFAVANDPARRTAAAAGGCMLLRAAALSSIGGFAAVRDALIDDCALATDAQERGRDNVARAEPLGDEPPPVPPTRRISGAW